MYTFLPAFTVPWSYVCPYVCSYVFPYVCPYVYPYVCPYASTPLCPIAVSSSALLVFLHVSLRVPLSLTVPICFHQFINMLVGLSACAPCTQRPLADSMSVKGTLLVIRWVIGCFWTKLLSDAFASVYNLHVYRPMCIDVWPCPYVCVPVLVINHPNCHSIWGKQHALGIFSASQILLWAATPLSTLYSVWPEFTL